MPWLVGYPREKIAWFPTIDPEKCVKCGMCMNCRRSYEFDSGKALGRRRGKHEKSV
jgi:ferredoxin